MIFSCLSFEYRFIGAYICNLGLFIYLLRCIKVATIPPLKCHCCSAVFRNDHCCPPHSPIGVEPLAQRQ